VIDYLSGKYISLEDRYIYAKIWYDEDTGMIGKKGRLARVLYMTNIGTIPDETHVKVKIGEQIVGTIDEGFLERLRRGDIFVLGGNTYEFKFARGMVAQVNASGDRPPTVPSWFSDMLPLSFDLASEIQRFRKLLEQRLNSKQPKKDILKFIHDYLYVDKKAANAIYNYFNEQFRFSEIPHEKKILVEHYIDEEDRRHVVFHTLFGRRVNDVLSRALAYAIYKTQHKDLEIGINDNGFFLAYEKNINVLKAFSLLTSKDLRRILELAIDQTEVLKRRFRHCAARSLMILRNYKGKTKRVGRQQVSSMILLSAVKRISDQFIILKEARREVLEDLMDIDNSIKIVKMIEDGKIKIKEVQTRIPSPFALNLVMQGHADILKADDKVEFLKKMHQQILAKISLKH
jgi:ATP-dependent Lhr-like helicase